MGVARNHFIPDFIYKISINDRAVVGHALNKQALTGTPCCAIELSDGTIVTGKTGNLMGAGASTVLNALKVLGGVDDSIDIISPTVIEPVQKLKVGYMGSQNPRLHPDEILMALAISAVTNPTAKIALDQLSKLNGAQLHSTVTLSSADIKTFKKLGVDVTCEPKSKNDSLFNV